MSSNSEPSGASLPVGIGIEIFEAHTNRSSFLAAQTFRFPLAPHFLAISIVSSNFSNSFEKLTANSLPTWFTLSLFGLKVICRPGDIGIAKRPGLTDGMPGVELGYTGDECPSPRSAADLKHFSYAFRSQIRALANLGLTTGAIDFEELT